MKKSAFTICILAGALYADPSITELFESIKKAPAGVEDRLKLLEANTNVESSKSYLYPRFYGFGSYEHYSSATNLAPLLPTESSNIVASGGGFPFSQNLKKIGFKGSMPIINFSLYATIDEAKAFAKSAEARQKLESISKEALLVELDANLAFFERLEVALTAKKASLLKTKERVSVGVKNGRYPLADELKLTSAITGVEIALSDIGAKKSSTLNSIGSLTGVTLEKSVSLSLKKDQQEVGVEASLLPLQKSLEAKDFALKAAKRQFLPTLNLDGIVFRGWGEAYDNGENFQKDYGVIGAYLSMPLFDGSVFANNEKARVAKLQAQNALDKSKLELVAKLETLKSDEKAYKKELAELKTLTQANDKLLEIAKISYKNGRLSVEEYLRYEDALFDSLAQTALAEASLWKTRAAKAALSGVELSEIVE